MLTRQEAELYFGVDENDLEELVVEHGLMADLGPDGRITFVHPEGTQEALHVRFEREHGFRPDHPRVIAEAEAYREDQEREKRKRLKKNASALKEKVARRRLGKG